MFSFNLKKNVNYRKDREYSFLKTESFSFSRINFEKFKIKSQGKDQNFRNSILDEFPILS